MNSIEELIANSLHSSQETGGDGRSANIVDALFFIGRNIGQLAQAIERLGVNGASTPMGAIEALGLEIKKLAGALRGGFSEIANAITRE